MIGCEVVHCWDTVVTHVMLYHISQDLLMKSLEAGVVQTHRSFSLLKWMVMRLHLATQLCVNTALPWRSQQPATDPTDSDGASAISL